MSLTKDFKETVRERLQREPKFRTALLREVIDVSVHELGHLIQSNHSVFLEHRTGEDPDDGEGEGVAQGTWPGPRARARTLRALIDVRH